MTRFLFLGLLFCSFPAAATRCTEDIVEIINQPSGEVVFKTSATCNWCQLGPEWTAEAKRNSYAMLLTAVTASKPISFEWGSAVADCVPHKGLNSTSPLFMVLAEQRRLLTDRPVDGTDPRITVQM